MEFQMYKKSSPELQSEVIPTWYVVIYHLLIGLSENRLNEVT